MPFIVSSTTEDTIFIVGKNVITIRGRKNNIQRAYTEVSQVVLSELEQNSSFRKQLDANYYAIAQSGNDEKAENKTKERDNSALITQKILSEKNDNLSEDKGNIQDTIVSAVINA